MTPAISLRDSAPAAWGYHRASSRWAFNMLSPDSDETPEPGKEYLDAAFQALPPPAALPLALDRLIDSRSSCRSFADQPVGLDQLSALLRAGLGVVGATIFGNLELARRACPSPGGLYPLELYVIARRISALPMGIYHYHAVTHGLAQLRDAPAPMPLETYLFMGQPYAAEAAATLVISCVFARSIKKYRDRGYRYALIEAGHVGQNLSLAATALELGCCSLGGFLDAELGQLLRLDPEAEQPLYAVSVGVPT